jgi:hypothetical protein
MSVDASQSGLSPTDDERLERAIRDEVKRLIIDCTYTGRGHQTAGQFWAGVNSWLGLPAAIISALIAVGAAANAILGQSPLLTAGLAMCSAVLTSAHAFFHPDKLAEQHGLKGDRFISLRNDARLFLKIDLLTLAPKEWPARIHDLRRRYNALNEGSPRRIVRRDYESAKRSIAAGESGYENDPLWKELDE